LGVIFFEWVQELELGGPKFAGIEWVEKSFSLKGFCLKSDKGGLKKLEKQSKFTFSATHTKQQKRRKKECYTEMLL